MIVSARIRLAVALALLCAAGCSEKDEPPAGWDSGAAAGTGGTSAAGRGGGAAVGGASGAGGSGANDDAGRGGTSGAGGSGGASAGLGGSSGGGGGNAGEAGVSGMSAGTSGASGASAGGTEGGGEGGNSAGAAGESGSAGSSCPNPTTTVDTSNLTVDDVLETYTVTGNTANEIRQSINANRDGDYDAFTSWYLTWQYSNSACDGSGLVVLVDIVYSMPEWDAPPAADPALVDEWNAYMDALSCHEYGHAELGLYAANDVYTTLSAIDAGGDCAAQQTQADAAFQAILDDYIAREIAYDEDTNHGATMGAIFPQP